MPTYEYAPIEGQTGCDACSQGLETLESMSEAPLTKCPECGVSIARVLTGCRVNTKPSDKTVTSDKNLKRLGFQKFEKGENGYTQTV